jgi:uroporphyrinogen-III synthase
VPTVTLLSAPGTLTGIDSILQRSGVRLWRIASIVPRPVDPETWRSRLSRATRLDTVLVTSRAAVSAGVRPWVRDRPGAVTRLEFWAVGPGTAQALRALGVRRVRSPGQVGADGIPAAIGGEPVRTIVYFRSDRAGPRLARRLRDLGHGVLDLVVYRLEMPPAIRPHDRRRLLQSQLIVVTSPSSLTALKSRLDREAFDHVRHHVAVVVLGELSRRAVAKLGFRRVRVAPSTATQPFTRYLLQELGNAST